MSTSNGYADKASILRCERRYRDVETPAGVVRIRSFTARERGVIEQEKPEQMRARLVVLGVVDKEGNRIFADENLDAVLESDSAVVAAISDAIIDHIGISEADVEGIEKN